MLGRYFKAQLMVLLCGGLLVGPIFLIVYFALGPMARPYINWMFWVGLLVTGIDVLVALALTSRGANAAARTNTSAPTACWLRCASTPSPTRRCSSTISR